MKDGHLPQDMTVCCVELLLLLSRCCSICAGVCSHVLRCAPCCYLYFHSLEVLLLPLLFRLWVKLVQKLKPGTVWHCITKFPALLNTIVGILLLELALKKQPPKQPRKPMLPPAPNFCLKMHVLCFSCEWGMNLLEVPLFCTPVCRYHMICDKL